MNPVTFQEARPLTFGGAVRLLWVQPTDPVFHHVKILRKLTNDITGHTDPGATVVYSGGGVSAGEYRSVFLPDDLIQADQYRTTLDLQALSWATTYYYAIFACNADESEVSVAATMQARTPEASTFEEVDVIGELLAYLKSYLARQIQTAKLPVRAGVNVVQIIEGPPLIDSKFPVVSLHLDADTPVAFTLADELDQLDEAGDVKVRRRGYLSEVHIRVQGWSENPDTRRHLYRTLKGALVSVRELMETLGVMNLSMTGQYLEEFEKYNMPLFIGALTLTGQMQTSVRETPDEPVIAEIDVIEPTLTGVSIAAP